PRRGELDRREVIRLEIRRLVVRNGADDEPRIDADDIAGPVQLQTDVDVRSRVAVDVEGDVHRSPAGHARARRLRGRDRRADALAHPREEAVRGRRVAHAISRSWLPTICSL